MENLIDHAAAIGRILVGAVLLLAGAAKLAVGVDAVQRTIVGYQLTSAGVARTFARVLPAGEILVGFLLCTGLLVNAATIVAFVLVFAFSAAIALNLLRERQHSCGCFAFGAAALQPIQWRLVYRNLFLLGLLAISVQAAPRWLLAASLGFETTRMPAAIASCFNYALILSTLAVALMHLLKAQSPPLAARKN